jgi:hypothetical protein
MADPQKPTLPPLPSLEEPLYVIPPRPNPTVRKKAAQASKVTQRKRSSRSTKRR